MTKEPFKLDPEFKAKWLSALRSGKYKQAKGVLVDVDADGEPVGYCCLGVACDLLPNVVKAELDGALEPEDDHGRGVFVSLVNHDDVGSDMPPEAVEYAVFGGSLHNLHVPSEDLTDDLRLVAAHISNFGDNRLPAFPTLPSLNDSGATFEQIADLIERVF